MVRQKIQGLLRKRVTAHTKHKRGEFISPIFVKSKTDAGLRLILNLKFLNKSVACVMPNFVIFAPLCDFFCPTLIFLPHFVIFELPHFVIILPHFVIFLPHFVILCVIVLGGYHLEVIVSRQNCKN